MTISRHGVRGCFGCWCYYSNEKELSRQMFRNETIHIRQERNLYPSPEEWMLLSLGF